MVSLASGMKEKRKDSEVASPRKHSEISSSRKVSEMSSSQHSNLTNGDTKPNNSNRLLNRVTPGQIKVSIVLTLISIVIVFSAILLVISSILIASFKLHLMTMASGNFVAAPTLMIIASCLAIGYSLLCLLLISPKWTKLTHLLLAIGCLVIVVQIVAVVLCFVCRNKNIRTDFNKINVDKELRLASVEDSAMEVWNQLQARYKCCGGRGKAGYREWENHLPSYPDSCCTVKYPECGLQAKRTLETQYSPTIFERIHVSGCVTEIKESLDTYVSPLLLAWALLGILVALCLILQSLLFYLLWKHQQRSESKIRKVRKASCPVHGGPTTTSEAVKPASKEKEEPKKEANGRKVSSVKETNGTTHLLNGKDNKASKKKSLKQ